MAIRTILILCLLAQQLIAWPCLAVGGLNGAERACRSVECEVSNDSCCCEPDAALMCDCAANPLPQPQPAPSLPDLIKFFALPTAFLIVAAPIDLGAAFAYADCSVELALTAHDRCALLCRWVT